MSEIMTFLSGLKVNNTLDWMHDHRAEYRAALRELRGAGAGYHRRAGP